MVERPLRIAFVCAGGNGFDSHVFHFRFCQLLGHWNALGQAI